MATVALHTAEVSPLLKACSPQSLPLNLQKYPSPELAAVPPRDDLFANYLYPNQECTILSRLSFSLFAHISPLSPLWTVQRFYCISVLQSPSPPQTLLSDLQEFPNLDLAALPPISLWWPQETWQPTRKRGNTVAVISQAVWTGPGVA